MYKSIYSFMWAVIKPYKLYCFIMLSAPVISSFFLFANNYALKLLVDAFSNAKSHIVYSDLKYAIIIFIGAQVVRDVAWRISNIAGWKSEPFIRQSIILKSYNRVQHYSYKFFQDNFSGSVLSKIKGVLDGYDNFWSQIHHELTPRVCEVVILILALAIINIYIFVFMTIWSIVVSIVMYKMANKLKEVSYSAIESQHNIFGKLSDNITNIFSLFFFATRKKELNILEGELKKEFIPRQLIMDRYHFKIQVVGSIFYYIMVVGVLFYIIYLKNQNKITTGDLVFVFTTTINLSESLWQMIMQMQDFVRQIGQFKSSFQILQHPEDNIDTPDAKEIKLKDASIKFENVNFGYREENLVFKDLSLNIRSGEKIGIVGISGAGKSSLVGVLLKQFPIESGKILVGEQDINEVTSDSLREKIALIPQDILLFHRSILENIRYGRLEASDIEVKKAASMANLDEFIMELPDGYNTLVGERGVKLSGGQRQRIAIARAILKNAPILILDEASSSLDTETEQLIQQSINLMLENKNFTIIAIAHRLSTLKYMDRIIVLDKGKITEEGKHDDLIQDPSSLYKKLWEMQNI